MPKPSASNASAHRSLPLFFSDCTDWPASASGRNTQSAFFEEPLPPKFPNQRNSHSALHFLHPVSTFMTEGHKAVGRYMSVPPPLDGKLLKESVGSILSPPFTERSFCAKQSHTLALITFRSRQTLYSSHFDEKKMFQHSALARDSSYLLELV